MKKTIETTEAPQAIGPYSQAVCHNGLLYLSGQIPLDPVTGALVDGGIREQTERVFRNLEAVLHAGGSSFEAVLKTTVYLQNIDDFSLMNEIYGTFFSEHKPARSTIEAARLPRKALIEIDAIAAIA